MSGMMRSASSWISSFSASLRFFSRASSSWSQLPVVAQQLDLLVEAAMLGLEQRQHLAADRRHSCASSYRKPASPSRAGGHRQAASQRRPSRCELGATNGRFRDLFTELSRVSQRKEIDRWTRPMPRHSHLSTLLSTRSSTKKSTAPTRTMDLLDATEERKAQAEGRAGRTLALVGQKKAGSSDERPAFLLMLSELQSSRETRSIRSCFSCASSVIVAIGRASSRASEIGSPVTSQ